jgi:hypothetical protein
MSKCIKNIPNCSLFAEFIEMLLVKFAIVNYNYGAHRRAVSLNAPEGFSERRTKQFNKVNALDLLAFKRFWRITWHLQTV